MTLVNGTKYVIRESLDELVDAGPRLPRSVIVAPPPSSGAPSTTQPPDPPVAAPQPRPRASASTSATPCVPLAPEEQLMDPASLIGVGLALGRHRRSMIMEGGDIGSIFLIPPMILVFGGTIGAAVAGGMMPDAKPLPKSLIRAFTGQAGHRRPTTVDDRVKLAEQGPPRGPAGPRGRGRRRSRTRSSSAALETGRSTAPTPRRSPTSSAPRSTPSARPTSAAAKIFHDMGGYAPTIGIIGTVLGLVHVLGNLSDPSKLGEKIAGAFVATLWGVMTANMLLVPDRPTGSSGSARSSASRWRWSSRACWPSRPAPTRG